MIAHGHFQIDTRAHGRHKEHRKRYRVNNSPCAGVPTDTTAEPLYLRLCVLQAQKHGGAGARDPSSRNPPPKHSIIFAALFPFAQAQNHLVAGRHDPLSRELRGARMQFFSFSLFSSF